MKTNIDTLGYKSGKPIFSKHVHLDYQKGSDGDSDGVW